MVCYYELGETEQAEQLFEIQIPMLTPINKRMRQAMEFLLADRLFYLKRFEESMEKYVHLKQEKISKRKRLEILFRMGQIQEAGNNLKAAEKLYLEVAENGKKLWIGQQAAQYINRKETS
jgi:tetratricopeptide (TPR) repeat protein